MSKITKSWTRGVPADVAAKVRAALADKGIGGETLAALVSDVATLEAATEAGKRVRENQRLVWQYVALSFGESLPSKGRGSKAETEVRAALLAEMGGDTPAARKMLGTYRWAGILAMFAPERGDATLYALAEQAEQARAVVTGAESMPETAKRKPRTSGDTPKGGKTPDAPKAPKAVTPTALAGALVTTPKATTATERARLDERAVAWLIQSKPEWVPADAIAALATALAERDAAKDAAPKASGE